MARWLGMFARRNALGLLALFAALGGTSYALSSSGSSGSLSACVKGKGGAVRFVKNGAKCRKHEKLVSWNKQGRPGATGQQGPKGDQGPAGLKGDQGLKGDTGPAGAASQSQTIPGPLTTSSTSPQDLGGPSVTVNVGPSGLVGFWATATIASTGGSGVVQLNDSTGTSDQMSYSGGPAKQYTLPDSNSGTVRFNGGMSTDQVGPGTHTFTLEYYDTTGAAAFFSDVELVVVPL